MDLGRVSVTSALAGAAVAVLLAGNVRMVDAGVLGTSGTVILATSPFPAPHDDHIFVFDERRAIPFVATQSLDFGIIEAGTLVDSHYVQYDPAAPTGLVGGGDIVFDGPVLGVITSTAHFDADLAPAVAAAGDSYFGLADVIGPYPTGADPSARGLGSPEDDLVFALGQNALTIESLEVPVRGNIDAIRVFTRTAIPVPSSSALLVTALLAHVRRRSAMPGPYGTSRTR